MKYLLDAREEKWILTTNEVSTVSAEAVHNDKESKATTNPTVNTELDAIARELTKEICMYES